MTEAGGVAKSDNEFLAEELRYILERNQNEKFLRKLLTRAIVLEKLLKDYTGKVQV